MPIYEYRCQACGKVSSFFTRSIGDRLDPVCSHCQSQDMRRRMSSFALGKSVDSVHERSASGSGPKGLDYYSDPRNIGRNVEESFVRHGMEMPETARETIDAARDGQLPKGLEL